ncbi:MAG: ATP-binding protein [Sedimentisphaerales bacterium]|nr:ATP-binding protein [Sedimentisphaerales bacterium]
MVDLSGVVGDRLESVLAKARKLVENKELSKAALAYAQAAKLMKQYADSATSDIVKKKRLVDSEKLQSYADQLKKGHVPNMQDKASAASNDIDITLQEDDYLANARSLITQAKISWDEIAGLDDIKKFVMESYALSLAKLPDGVGLPKAANLLLYGPPGTGKTLIAAAVSKGLEATFFSCKVSDMLSKYFGESSRLIDAIFELATQMSPSVIFLDDFESIVPSRDSDSSGVERRVLTELLTCMDGFANKSSDHLVLVIAATNKPWLIDQAILSRFGKLAYVGLPDDNAREKIFELLLTKKGYKIRDSLRDFAKKTLNYSGREIEQISKELIRTMISKANPDLADIAVKGKKAVEQYMLKMSDITIDDLEALIEQMVPMTNQDDLTKYEQWNRR